MKYTLSFIKIMLFVLLSVVFFVCPLSAQKKATNTGVKKGDVKIIRDNYGVPHVYAKDTYGLFYGYGYSIAVDRLFQMEMTKRTVLGAVAEVLGEDYVDYDKSIRSNYTPSSIENQYNNLPNKYKEIFIGYADGLNKRIDEVYDNIDDLLPKQFDYYNFKPSYWSPVDVVMIFVGTMANRFSDFNTEIDNLKFLTYLEGMYSEDEAWNMFNQTKWMNDPSAPTTVPKEESKNHYSKSAIKNHNLNNNFYSSYIKEKQKINGISQELYEMIGLPDNNKILTSNCWVVGDKKTYDKGSILMNGPQFGWYTPGYVYEIGLHGAGFDLIGNTPFGYPAILFGHNKHIAWGSTAGLGDHIDIYIEEIRGEDGTYQYKYNEKWLDMKKRTETIEVKDSEPATIDVYRTIHGLVVALDEDSGIAFSKKRAWDGYEVESLIGWLESTKAHNYQQWKKAASKNALTINWYYADKRGNIGYIHTGKYPLRQDDHDWRLPVSGTGENEWLGILPFDQNPQVYNPEQGFIANWNNKPSKDWNDPDMWWLLWGRAHRVEPIINELSSQNKFTPDEIWDMNYKFSFYDITIPYFLPFLEEAVADEAEDSPLYKAVNLMSKWDRMRVDEDDDGYYDSAAQTIFQKWLELMLKNTFQDDFQDYFWRYSSTGYPSSPSNGSMSVSLGSKILYHALLGNESSVPNQYDFFNDQDPLELVSDTLSKALSVLDDNYNGEMETWKLPAVQHKFFTNNFNGIPQAMPDEDIFQPVYMNRGTQNHIVSLHPWGVEGHDVCPPGQSGYISLDGVASPHYDDQLEMYVDFESKEMLYYYEDVLEEKESVKILEYK